MYSYIFGTEEKEGQETSKLRSSKITRTELGYRSQGAWIGWRKQADQYCQALQAHHGGHFMYLLSENSFNKILKRQKPDYERIKNNWFVKNSGYWIVQMKGIREISVKRDHSDGMVKKRMLSGCGNFGFGCR